MARRKKGKCKWGRRKDGLCRKRPRGRRKAAGKSRRQAKPTPLFADIVRFARKGSRFTCESPERDRIIQIADGALKSTLANLNSFPAEMRATRLAGYRRARQQINQASERGCAQHRRKLVRMRARELQQAAAAGGGRSENGLGPTAHQSYFTTEPTPPSPPSGGGGSPPSRPRPDPERPPPGNPPPAAAAAAPRLRKDLKQLYLTFVAQNPHAGSVPEAFIPAPPKVLRSATYHGEKLEVVRQNKSGTLRIRVPTYHRNQKNPRDIRALRGEFVVIKKNDRNGQMTVMRKEDYERDLGRYFRNVAYQHKHGPLRVPITPVPEAIRASSRAGRRSSRPALEPMNLHTPLPSSMPVLDPPPDPFSVPPNWPAPLLTRVPDPTGPYGKPRSTRPHWDEPGRETGDGPDDSAE